MKTIPCKGCSKPIVWGHNVSDGKRIPLDPRPPVYLVTDSDKGALCVRAPVPPPGPAGYETAYMVSHFATCPNAAEFSKNRKPVGKS